MTKRFFGIFRFQVAPLLRESKFHELFLQSIFLRKKINEHYRQIRDSDVLFWFGLVFRIPLIEGFFVEKLHHLFHLASTCTFDRISQKNFAQNVLEWVRGTNMSSKNSDQMKQKKSIRTNYVQQKQQVI